MRGEGTLKTYDQSEHCASSDGPCRKRVYKDRSIVTIFWSLRTLKQLSRFGAIAGRLSPVRGGPGFRGSCVTATARAVSRIAPGAERASRRIAVVTIEVPGQGGLRSGNEADDMNHQPERPAV